MIISPENSSRLTKAISLIAAAKPELPINCGLVDTDGVNELPEWQDYSTRASTLDQICIEASLKEIITKNDIVLHIGVGDSGLASRFSPLAKWIHGVTIMPQEAERSKLVALPNYSVLCISKYGPSFLSAHRALLGRTSCIIDNNPSTFCCCISHYAQMLHHYWILLKDRGYFMTHKLGLGWVAAPNLADWRLTPNELALHGDLIGFDFIELGKEVYGLQKRSGQKGCQIHNWDYPDCVDRP